MAAGPVISRVLTALAVGASAMAQPAPSLKTVRPIEAIPALVEALGSHDVAAEPPPIEAASVCANLAYIRTRLQRMAIAGLPPSQPEWLRKLCGIQ